MIAQRKKEIPGNQSFECLHGDLSAELVTMSHESIDAAIVSSLKTLVEFEIKYF